jgi:23S rRNA pseudouridine2605 synthase
MKHRPAFWIFRREHKPPHPGERQRTRAHRARLKRHEQLRVRQPFIAQSHGTGAQDQHFGVGGGIAPLQNTVAVPRQKHTVRRQQDRANRNFAAAACVFGFRQRQCYGFFVIHARPNRKNSLAEDTSQGERIAKVIARAGICSRRDAEKLIAEGRVKLNGEVVTTPAIKVGADHLIEVDSNPVGEAQPARLWRYHKPAGLVTTHKDPKNRPTVFAALPKNLGRVVSVGRLDFNSEGLLLLTNDGGIARRLEVPSAGWVRKYRARLFGRVTQADLDKLATGAIIAGIKYGPILADIERSKGVYSWVTVSLKEGKNREIKRVMESLGLKVARLIRISYGPFQLGHLAEGAVEEIPARLWREQLGIGRKKRVEAAS